VGQAPAIGVIRSVAYISAWLDTRGAPDYEERRTWRKRAYQRYVAEDVKEGLTWA